MPEFDPSLTSSHENGIYGLPYSEHESKLILIPVPWEVTASYGGGSALGPEAILKASPQIDLYDFEFKTAYEQGIHMLEVSSQIKQQNADGRQQAKRIFEYIEKNGPELSDELLKAQDLINQQSVEIQKQLKNQCLSYLKKGKIPCVVGGDHSVPLGAIEAYSEHYEGDYGILHIDAHADLRVQYQGFKQSHASIMDNVLKLPKPPKRLVQVGIRDFCEEEYEAIQSHSSISCFFDRENKKLTYRGLSWNYLCEKIVNELPQNVYISFDIDGLTPNLCPHTGTPVPGGVNFEEVVHLLSVLNNSGKNIIGFDLCEVAPDPTDSENEWDGNVGARVLYQLCGWTLSSQK